MSFLKPRKVAHAHCDLMCGVYDPAQARIEAESVKAIAEKYQDSDDRVFKQHRDGGGLCGYAHFSGVHRNSKGQLVNHQDKVIDPKDPKGNNRAPGCNNQQTL